MDFIPGLEHLPLMLQPWPRKLKSLVGREMELQLAFLRTLQQAVKDGTAPDCFGKQLVQVGTVVNFSAGPAI